MCEKLLAFCTASEASQLRPTPFEGLDDVELSDFRLQVSP
jgi:hypothetical protein